MKIVVSEIPEEGLDIECEEEIEYAGAGTVCSAGLSLRVDNVGPEVLVKGTVSATLELVCGRCLKEFVRRMTIPVDFAYSPEDEISGEGEYQLTPDELNTSFYSGDEIDLGEMVKEQLLLGIPMRPLCSDSCKGICQACGADLNEVKCVCDMSSIDPRMQKLKEYFNKGKE
jgi:uncharacterized protein